MSSESLITFNRDLERGFDMVRPEDGEVGTMPAALEDYGSKSVNVEEIVRDTPVVAATARFFKE
jgi:hypothetical protein